jgi:hypothetical protein
MKTVDEGIVLRRVGNFIITRLSLHTPGVIDLAKTNLELGKALNILSLLVHRNESALVLETAILQENPLHQFCLLD